MNKRGWIRVIEATIAILLIIGVLLVFIDRSNGDGDLSDEVYEMEISILQGIQMNDSLRQEILDAGVTDWIEFPQSIKDKIDSEKLDYLDCTAKICEIDSSCFLESYPEADTYAQSITITSTLSDYDPLQLKIFCWEA